MRTVITADFHLTDRPEDEYRWEFLAWLRNYLKQGKREGRINRLVVLGDITEAKDGHSAKLVNRIVAWFAKCPVPVIVLKGNHDYAADATFFKFLNRTGNVAFIDKPTELVLGGKLCVFVPHMKPKQFIEYCDRDWSQVAYVFMHQTIKGAIAESGERMDGIPRKVLSGIAGKIYSGDIHRPQAVWVTKWKLDVRYVGAPYPIRFGDTFTPEVVEDDWGGMNWSSVFPPHVRKEHLTVRDVFGVVTAGLKKGDQAKVTVKVLRSEVKDWPSIRRKIVQHCERKGIRLAGIDLDVFVKRVRLLSEAKPGMARRPGEILDSYTDQTKARFKKTGKRILESVK